MTDTERTNSVLTSTQREFLRNQGDYYTGEYAKQQRYERREGIKKRVWHGLLDGEVLFRHTTPDQRRAIFNGWKEFAAPAHDSSNDPPGSVERMTELLRAAGGFSSWISFLYLGLSESDGFSFGDVLREGIEQAEESRGRIVTGLDFDVDTRERRSLEELKTRFQQRTDLSAMEMQRLRAAGKVTDEELVAYYNEREQRFQKAAEITPGDSEFTGLAVDSDPDE